MKKLFMFLMFIIALELNAQLPDVEMQNIDNEWTALESLKGEKLTVVDFWATWCKPCVSAIPKLNSIYSELNSQGVEFIGVNTDGPRNQSKVKPFARSLNIKYPVLLDPDQELVNQLNVTVFPTLLVFNSKGKLVYTHEGFNAGDEVLIKSEIQKILAR